MAEVQIEVAEEAPSEVSAFAVAVFEGSLDDTGVSTDYLAARGFEGKVGQAVSVPGANGTGALVLVGLGPAGGTSRHDARRAGASLARAGRRHTTIAMRLDGPIGGDVELVTALAEGAHLAAYEFLTLKSDPKPGKLERIVLVAPGLDGDAVTRALAGTAAARWARDLVNTPGGDLTPAELARSVRDKLADTDLGVVIRKRREITDMGLGGLLGVNRGSSNPPRFIEVSYQPEGEPVATVALVGKGITFDSGGLSIKPGQGMMTMKSDMAGAAAVLATMTALPAVAPPVAVTAYVAATDNMLGGDATRPGDVLKIRNGKTIEVLNTDAEGRLVLADALSVASEATPDVIVDLATLTGACMVALGPKIAGLFTNDDELAGWLRASADHTGERIWPLPIPDDYRKMIDSTVADMKNIGGPHGGAITAALLLKEFVGDGIAWAHLDIAGPSFTDKDEAEITKGGTGFGVRLLLDLITRIGNERASSGDTAG
ncbi:MAG: leucyl aminopeptidase [Actinomycetota bacterium]|nr:leucyl aminopeptidase [Actinomycetota bacterium]